MWNLAEEPNLCRCVARGKEWHGSSTHSQAVERVYFSAFSVTNFTSVILWLLNSLEYPGGDVNSRASAMTLEFHPVMHDARAIHHFVFLLSSTLPTHTMHTHTTKTLTNCTRARFLSKKHSNSNIYAKHKPRTKPTRTPHETLPPKESKQRRNVAPCTQ